MSVNVHNEVVAASKNNRNAAVNGGALMSEQPVSTLPVRAGEEGEEDGVDDENVDVDAEADAADGEQADARFHSNRRGAHARQLDEVRAKLQAMSMTRLPRLSIPVREMIYSAEALYKWCQEDKAELIDAGLDWEIVESIPLVVDALTEAQIRWMNVRYCKNDDEVAWRALARQAKALRKAVLRYMRFAFRNDDGLQRQIKRIGKGGTFSDLVEEVNLIALLVNEQRQPLEAIGMPAQLLDDVFALSTTLSDKRASATVESAQNREKQLRDQVYAYLTSILRTVREHGRFVCDANPQRRKGYGHGYYRKLRSRRIKNKAGANSKTANKKSTKK